MNFWSELTTIAARPEAAMLTLVLGLALMAISIMRRGDGA